MNKVKRIWASILVFILLALFIPATSLACEECGMPYEYVYVRTTGNVNLREAPDIRAKILTTIDKDNYFDSTELVYTPDGRCWVGVIYCGEYGYISDRYLEYISRYWVYPEHYVNPIDECSLQFNAIRNCKAYSYIDTDFEVVKRYSTGSIIDIYLILVNYEDGSLWGETRFYSRDDEIYYGYIPLKYLKSTDSSLPKFSKYMKVTGGTVNIREEPDIESTDIGTLYKNDVVLVGCFIPTFDGRIWASVSMRDGTWLGYTSMKYLKATR